MNFIMCNKAEYYAENLEYKGEVQPKIKIASSFTHPRFVPNLYEHKEVCLFVCLNKKIKILQNISK